MGRKRDAAGSFEEEEVFVRGGGSGLAPIVNKQLRQEAYAEAEADLLASDGKKKGGKRRKLSNEAAATAEGGDEEDAFFSGLALQGKLPKFVELLKFKSLSRGCKLWGAVIELSPRELVVSMPHGLRGHVAYAEASDWLAEQSKKVAAAQAQADAEAQAGSANGGGSSKKRKAPAAGAGALPPLTELFSIGQLVRCTVVGLHSGSGTDEPGKAGKKAGPEGGGGGKKKRVDVSLRVSKMNAGLGLESLREGLALPASVRSVEDHGYLLALGIKGVSGFLPKKAAAAAGRPLAPGMLLEVVVPPGGAPKPAGGGGSVLTVDCAPEAVASTVAREWDGLNIVSLMPGQLVTARVRNVLSDGLLCSFLTYFSGTVDPFHLGTDVNTDWRKQFSPNQRLRARILFVDPVAKRVGLSLQRHLLANSLPPNFPMLGHVFEDAIVRRLDEGLGLLLELPAQGAQALTPGYAHISTIDDTKVEELAKRFRAGQKVRARVLGFRPMDGLAVLSLKPSVVDSSILSLADVRPGMPVSATVNKVEEFGLLVSITTSIRALVPVIHASDVGSAKALRKYKPGQKVAGKVLSVDPVSKKVTMTLKPSILGSKLPPITCLEDAMPGSRTHGVVTGAQEFGVFISFFGAVKGLAHASECGLAPGQKPADAFQPGQVVKCRVLGADSSGRGLKLSLVTKPKKAAAAAEGVEPEVEPAAAAAAATAEAAPAGAGDGAGTEAGAPKDAAAARAREAALYEALASYQPGDLVQGIITAVHTRDEDGEAVPIAFEVSVTHAAGRRSAPPAPGRLEVAHLSDHPRAAAVLQSVLKVGTQLDSLLVLQHNKSHKQLRLTRKGSMVAAAQAGVLPASLDAVKEATVLPGYVVSITNDAVFVRFLGQLTGRAGLAQLSDTFVSDPHLVFRTGQSVRATIVQVDAQRQRFSVALKQSLCGSRDAAYLQHLFSDLGFAEKLSDDPTNWSAIAIGSVVPGEVHEVTDFGLVCDLEADADVVALVAKHQVPPGFSQEPGTSLQAVVLDVNKKEGMVDLSLQPRLLQLMQAAAAAAVEAGGAADQPPKKKKKQQQQQKAEVAAAPHVALKEGQQLEVTIELVNEQGGYCIASLPAAHSAGGGPVLGFVPTTDFNLQQQQLEQVKHQFKEGESLTVTVAALPSDATGGRLLLSAPLTAKALRPARLDRAQAGDADGEKAKRRQDGAQQGQQGQQARQQQKQKQPAVGSCVQATVGAVHALHAELELAGGCHGRLHITEAAPLADGSAGNPLSPLTTGDTLLVAVLGRVQTKEGRRHAVFECTNQPNAVKAAKAKQPLTGLTSPGWGAFEPGQQLFGYVQELERGYVWCIFAPNIRGRAFATQAASSIEECEQLGKHYKPGQPVQATVVHVDKKRKAMDVSLLPASKAADTRDQLTPGSVALGRITAVGGTGVRVQLSAHSGGRVALTDIHDVPVQQVLAGLKVGQYCQAAVLGLDKASSKHGSKNGGEDSASHYLLSLRPSAGGQCPAHTAAQQAQQGKAPELASGQLQPQELKQGQQVAGYVKSASPSGVFVCLSRNLDARIRLSQLADGFVESPAEAFPEGQLVVAQVLSVEGSKVELTLRNRKVAPNLDSLEEGQVVRGRVKKVTQYGVFVELEGQPGGTVTGLAHVSEVADDFVKDPAELFSPGQRVVARVLKVESKAGRLSLGLKPSYFEHMSDLEGSDGAWDEGGGDSDFDAELAQADANADSSSDEEIATKGDEKSDEGDEEAGNDSGNEEEDEEAQQPPGSSDSEEDADFDLDDDLATAGGSSSNTSGISSDDEQAED